MEAKGQVYFEPPLDFNQSVEIATCYIRYEGQLLFLKRQPYKTQGNMWGIPGGKVGFETCPLQGMLREVKEETQLDLDIDEVVDFGTVYCRYPTCDFTYHMFGYRLIQEKPEIKIHL